VRGTRLAGASSRFLCLSFFAAAKKVSAAPHRGNANRPLRKQGKANAAGKQTNNRPAVKHLIKGADQNHKKPKLPLRAPKH
jgi:hypothetical protein